MQCSTRRMPGPNTPGPGTAGTTNAGGGQPRRPVVESVKHWFEENRRRLSFLRRAGEDSDTCSQSVLRNVALASEDVGSGARSESFRVGANQPGRLIHRQASDGLLTAVLRLPGKRTSAEGLPWSQVSSGGARFLPRSGTIVRSSFRRISPSGGGSGRVGCRICRRGSKPEYSRDRRRRPERDSCCSRIRPLLFCGSSLLLHSHHIGSRFVSVSETNRA